MTSFKASDRVAYQMEEVMLYSIATVDVYPHNEYGEQLETGMKTYYHVMKGSKLLMSFEDRGDAEIYIQDCVEEARWNAANRD